MRDRDGRFFLCDRQREILEFVTSFMAQHRFSPTVREIVGGTSITSTSVAAYHLDILRGEGYVWYERNKARTLRVLRQPVCVRDVCDRS
jgi:repressor LexA